MQRVGIATKDEAILLIEDSEYYFKTFWACILGGIIPVPVTVGHTDEHKIKLVNIWKSLNHPYLIAESKVFSSYEKVLRMNHTSLCPIIQSRTIDCEQLGTGSGEGKIYPAKPEEIAFLQFSSGSTGDPKGVILTHKNIMTNVEAMISGAQLNNHDIILNWMPFTHDMGMIGGHLAPVLLGMTQYYMPTSLFIKSPTLWMKKISQYKVTLTTCPNFGYRYFLAFYSPENAMDWDLSHLRLIFNGAEPISSQLCNEFLDKMEQYGLSRNAIYPVYGLAEASLAVSFPPAGEGMTSVLLERNSLNMGENIRLIQEGDLNQAVTFVDVGYPVKNCMFRICDSNHQALEDEIIGFIQIRGDNVTRGYYNNREATATAFTKDGWLITGDLGFTRKGRLVVTGRAKDIIFVNGQNYYPHDIERVAMNIPDFQFTEIAAGSAFNENTQQEEILLFVLYKKALQDFIPIVQEIKKHVSRQMGLEVKEVIPIKKVPKTTSGKIQRYKLIRRYLDGEFGDTVGEMNQMMVRDDERKEVHLPGSVLEEKLLVLFQSVLGKEKIGIDDNFFECGGHSLNANMLILKIQKELEVQLPLSKLFELPAISQLAPYIQTAKENKYSPIISIKQREFYPCSSAQKRMFVLWQFEPNSTVYNMPGAIIIDGYVERQQLEGVFSQIIARHEILRTTFQLLDGIPVQRIFEDFDFHVDFRELADGPEIDPHKVIEGLIEPFDLRELPLLRVVMVKLQAERYLLFVDMHHIISDAVSMGIFIKELSALMQGQELPELKIQYKDFAVWQNELFKRDAIKEQEAYWLNLYRNQIPEWNFPTDFPRSKIQSFEGECILFGFGEEVTDKLRTLGLKTGTTLFMILLAVFDTLLFKYCGQSDILVGTPIAGRTFIDLQNVMGMFVNMLAVRSFPRGEKPFKRFLAEIKENCLRAYDNQDFPLEMLVDKLAAQKGNSGVPLFHVAISMVNMRDNEIVIPGRKVTLFPVTNRICKFDFTLEIAEEARGLLFNLSYAKKLFHPQTMERFAGYFQRLIEKILENPDLQIDDIELELPLSEPIAGNQKTAAFELNAIEFDL